MLRYLLILFLLCFSLTLKAQNNAVNFDINDYKHTINFIDHKIVFQVKPNKEPKSTDPIRKYHWYSNNRIQITQGGFSGKLLNGNYNDFYLSNNLKEKGVFKAGLKDGEWHIWAIDGVLMEKVNYKEGILHGQFFKYDQLGNLLQEGNYKAGKINGIYKTYHGPDSVVISKYKEGLIENPSQSWIKQVFAKKHN
ncbi:hypothetical protein FA048_00065 [Pedobacter polaris]|uniref:Toxin-antitoxin system YwqK family antitoxin n=1 Tax=Pedobacter polaris TaxID=2571273 RepID=A0A4U1CXB6_9SPHI|nr:hypothetical protein [Pedobacter polaris]TKC12049.1 hypothetical protein FA048_00065 [Pedobacter polaris]